MIVADVEVDEAGVLLSCGIRGHAGAGPRGGDIVCAAVSVLARTAYRTLSGMDCVKISGGASVRGRFGFTVERLCDRASAEEALLVGATAFLREGLCSVAADYPDNCTVNIRTERRQDNGN